MSTWLARKNSPSRFSDLARKMRMNRFHWVFVIAVPLCAILFQVYVPRFVTRLAYLELPLLVTIYFGLMSRSPVAGVVFGSLIGLAQDSLSHLPLGMFGIAKTLVGYFVATVSQRLEVENTPVRFTIALLFFCFHHIFYWVLARALLGERFDLEPGQMVVLSALNAAVAVPLYRLLDRLRIVE
jgi:rod shape-determining protein MreD